MPNVNDKPTKVVGDKNISVIGVNYLRH